MDQVNHHFSSRIGLHVNIPYHIFILYHNSHVNTEQVLKSFEKLYVQSKLLATAL